MPTTSHRRAVAHGCGITSGRGQPRRSWSLGRGRGVVWAQFDLLQLPARRGAGGRRLTVGQILDFPKTRLRIDLAAFKKNEALDRGGQLVSFRSRSLRPQRCGTSKVLAPGAAHRYAVKVSEEVLRTTSTEKPENSFKSANPYRRSSRKSFRVAAHCSPLRVVGGPERPKRRRTPASAASRPQHVVGARRARVIIVAFALALGHPPVLISVCGLSEGQELEPRRPSSQHRQSAPEHLLRPLLLQGTVLNQPDFSLPD